jgi:hypothetical protein
MNTKDWERLGRVTESIQAMLDDKRKNSMSLWRGDLRVVLKGLRERGVRPIPAPSTSATSTTSGERPTAYTKLPSEQSPVR